MHIQEDHATHTYPNGLSEIQSYAYAPNLDAPRQVVRLTSKGWKIVRGNRVLVGHREKYRDPSF